MSAADAIRAREAARKPVVVKPKKPAKVAPVPAPEPVVDEIAAEAFPVEVPE